MPDEEAELIVYPPENPQSVGEIVHMVNDAGECEAMVIANVLSNVPPTESHPEPSTRNEDFWTVHLVYIGAAVRPGYSVNGVEHDSEGRRGTWHYRTEC